MPTRVLIVDDDPDTVRMLRLLLELDGFEAHTATSGTQGLEQAHAVRPDVILLDIMMPDIDGFEVCRRLRADQEIADTIVIMITANAASNTEEMGLKAGANRVLFKPITANQLRTEIADLLENKN